MRSEEQSQIGMRVCEERRRIDFVTIGDEATKEADPLPPAGEGTSRP